MKKITVFCLILFASTAVAQNRQISVSLPSEDIKFVYKNSPRLEQVLHDIHSSNKAKAVLRFPIAMQLFNNEWQDEANALKATVLKTLKKSSAKHPELKTSMQILMEQIKRWNIGYREFLTLDYDFIRLRPEANPLLIHQYELLTPSRTQKITIEGLVFRPRSVDVKASYTLSDYLSKVKKLSSADDSRAWIVYPDGHYLESGYAYWNSQAHSLTSNSVVFIGFQSKEPDIIELERKIIQLVRMRKGI